MMVVRLLMSNGGEVSTIALELESLWNSPPGWSARLVFTDGLWKPTDTVGTWLALRALYQS